MTHGPCAVNKISWLTPTLTLESCALLNAGLNKSETGLVQHENTFQFPSFAPKLAHTDEKNKQAVPIKELSMDASRDNRHPQHTHTQTTYIGSLSISVLQMEPFVPGASWPQTPLGVCLGDLFSDPSKVWSDICRIVLRSIWKMWDSWLLYWLRVRQTSLMPFQFGKSCSALTDSICWYRTSALFFGMIPWFFTATQVEQVIYLTLVCSTLLNWNYLSLLRLTFKTHIAFWRDWRHRQLEANEHVCLNMPFRFSRCDSSSTYIKKKK